MSLKMNVQSAVHIDRLYLKELQKIGWVQYRISLYFEAKHFKSKIYLMASNIDFQKKNQSTWVQPQIGSDTLHCYSSKFRVQYLNEPIQDGTTYYFKGYIDLTLIDKIRFYIKVDLLYSQGYASNFELVHSYTGHIKKVHNILAYLPIQFDKIGVLRMSGVYHAVLMEFKFQSSEDDAPYLQKQYKDIQDYLHSVTFGYRLAQTTNFYKYYRQTLESQIGELQARLSELSKIKDKEFHKVKFIKLNQNRKIEAMLGHWYNQSIENEVNNHKEQLVQLILQDILNIKALIYKIWNQINGIIRSHSSIVTQQFKSKYEYQFKERLKANIFSHRIKHHDWTFGKYDNTSKAHQQHAQIIRKKSQTQNQLWESTFLIQGQSTFENQSKCLKIFEEIYETGNVNNCQNVSKEYEHILILVHGFQAHRNDFIPLKQCLESRHKIKVYISGANIGKTQQSIQNCGRRLAIQINRMLQIVNKKYKLSFIGHSMGGIIIRSALKYLQNIKDSFHAFVSICSPHLGYLYSTSKLVHAGLWLINTLQKCDSILQLCMQDNKNLRQCFLYKLAQAGCLNSFKKIAFLTSSQDEYVAYESARVQKNALILTQQMKNKGESQVICQMVDNLLCQVQAFQILRLDVVFCIEETSLDTFLGRTGHIKFLSDPHFLKQFSLTLDHLFL